MKPDPAPPGRRITVMRIIDRLNIGGPAIHAVLTAAHLDPWRFRTLLVYGDIEPGEGDMSYLLDRPAGPGGQKTQRIRAVYVEGLSRQPRPLRDLRALWALYRLMQEERPDVVHTHKSKAGLLGRLAALLALVPVRVHTYHGHVLDGYFGRGQALALLLTERVLGRLTTRLVTLSERLRDDLSGRYHIAARERFQVVPLGLDLQPFREADGLRGRLRGELGLPGSVRLVGAVGRMVPIKDHATLIAGLARLFAERQDIHAVLVGSGETEAALRADVFRRGLSGRVHLLGWRRDLPAIYADLDVLALTSRNEGTPVAVIEALAAGVPVVATAVGGVPDVLRGGERGALVPAGDDAALCRALLTVLDDPAARDRAREPWRRDEICAEYGVDRLCSDLAALYEAELRAAGRVPVPGSDRAGPDDLTRRTSQTVEKFHSIG